MRIAFFVDGFPLISETFILRQITGLIDLGHEVHIYAERRPEEGTPVHSSVSKYGLLPRTTYMTDYMPPVTGYWQMPAFPITGETWIPGAEKPIGNLSRILEAVPAFARCFVASPHLAVDVLKERSYGHQAVTLSSLYRLRKLASVKAKYDVVHAHFGPVANTFRFIKKLWHKPFIVSFHGYDFSTYPRTHGSDIYGLLFDSVDAVTVNSEYTRNRLLALGCKPDKIHKLHVGLHLNDFQFRPRERHAREPVKIISVARLVEIKGLEYAVRAMSVVRDRYPQVTYEIIGEGPLRPALEQLIDDLRLQRVVNLHGAQPDSYVREVMSRSHIFIMPSVDNDGDQEGQGLALQEAQASGLPVIATEHGALPEGMLPGRSGLLISERDVKALADAVAYLIERPELCPVFGAAGREFVEKNYSMELLNRQLVDLYRDCVERNGG
jgi:colanic acid/amylovoran biosynthesis glycosyltransferase